MTAADIVNDYAEEELYRMIRDYGEDRFAKNIAKNIVKERKNGRVETAGQLNRIIEMSIPKKLQMTGGHPAKRTYQAIRIELNRELDVLAQNLDAFIDLLETHLRRIRIHVHVRKIFRYVYAGKSQRDV